MKDTVKTRKYKVVYKHKLRLIDYLVLSLVPISISFCLRFLNTSLKDFIDFHIPSIYIYIPYLILPPLYFGIYYTSKLSFSPIQKLKAKLFFVIKSNHFYFSEKFEGKERILSSLKFVFYFTDNKLIIDTYTNGANYTRKINELAELLESALSLPLLEMNTLNPEFTRYEFLLNKVEKLKITHLENLSNNGGNIQLDSEKTWDYIKNPHALIAGATSSGKTYMLYYLMLQFAKQGAELYIIDPKRSDLSSLIHFIPEGDKHVALTPTHIAQTLRKINDEMNYRYEKYFSTTSKMGVNYQYFNLHPIVIFFDEIAAFMEEDKKIAKEADAYLKQLIMKGRQAGVFIVLSTQKPNAEAISTSIRDQIGLRIALGQLSKPGYKMTLGDDWEELPSFETGTGKGLIMIDGLNWSIPRAFESPFMDLDTLKFQDTLGHFLEEGRKKYSSDKAS